MDIVDIRLMYKKDTGDPETPISSEPFESYEYIKWLERNLLRFFSYKKKKLGDISDEELLNHIKRNQP